MFFKEVAEGPPDAIFGLVSVFQADPRPKKVNLLAGIYHDEELRTQLMPSVKRAKEQILAQDLRADYLPIDGSVEFCEEIGKLAFGEEMWKSHAHRIYAAQTVGGTAALRIGGEFIAQEVAKAVFVSQPTWPNHHAIFERAGCKVGAYPYYERKKQGVDFTALCDSLEKISEGTVLLFHAACHNPTGCDLSLEEWKEVSRLIKKKRLLPFFDFAYQGFGEGVEKDREAVELFLKEGHEMLVAYSCSKNFSLYCQRVGALFIASESSAVKGRIGSQVKRIIRALYSNPPAHGVFLATHILKNGALKQEWVKDLGGMRGRMAEMRRGLVERLGERFHSLLKRKGMLSFIDLDKAQVQRMIDEFAIYLTDNGRINIAGLTRKNLDYVAAGVLAVSR